MSGVASSIAAEECLEHERLLRSASYLLESLTLNDGRILIALLCQSSSAGFERTFVRLVLWCRLYNRRDIISLLFPNPEEEAVELVGNVDDADIQILKGRLLDVEMDSPTWENNLLLKLQGENSSLQLIDIFRDELAERFQKLFEVHRSRLYRREKEKAGKRCTVELAEYDSRRYKPKHWVQALQPFINKGVYPPEMLAEMQRGYGAIPWPESCPILVDQYLSWIREPVAIKAPVARFTSVSGLLTHLIEADLLPAEVARLVLNASALGVRGLFLSKEMWVELAWSLLDGRRRTPELESDLSLFRKRRSAPVVEAVKFF